MSTPSTESLLPDLEKVCEVCSGKKYAYSSEEDAFPDCSNCNGSGFVPTESGKRILDLLRHNSRVSVTAQLCFTDASHP